MSADSVQTLLIVLSAETLPIKYTGDSPCPSVCLRLCCFQSLLLHLCGSQTVSVYLVVCVCLFACLCLSLHLPTIYCFLNTSFCTFRSSGRSFRKWFGVHQQVWTHIIAGPSEPGVAPDVCALLQQLCSSACGCSSALPATAHVVGVLHFFPEQLISKRVTIMMFAALKTGLGEDI